MATVTTELTHSTIFARLLLSCFIKNARNLASLGAGSQSWQNNSGLTQAV
jgi:hypothetical protein